MLKWLKVVPVLVLWAVPTVAVVVAFPLGSASERRSVAAPAVEWVEVGSRTVDERTAVDVVITRQPAPQLLSPVEGVVTVAAQPGPIEIGREIFAVNGVPVLAYRGAPLFRELQPGDTGADVEAVGDLLVDLELLAADQVTQHLNDVMLDGIRRLQRDTLGVDPDGVFRPTYAVRIVDEMVEVDVAVAGLGERVVVDTPIAGGPEPVTAIAFMPLDGRPTRFGDQPAVLRFGDIELELPSANVSGDAIADLAESLDSVQASGAAELQEEPGTSTQRLSGGILALQDPVTRGVVPSTAVLVDQTGAMCVMTESPAGPTPLLLDTAEPGNELATVLIPDALIGTRVLRDATSVPNQSACR